MMTKQMVMEAIKEWPGEELEMQQLKDMLYILDEIVNAEEDIQAGRTYTNEQMKEIIESWHQLSGQTLPKAI